MKRQLSYQVLLTPDYLRNHSQDEGHILILPYLAKYAKFPLPSFLRRGLFFYLLLQHQEATGIVFNSLLLSLLLSFLQSKRIICTNNVVYYFRQRYQKCISGLAIFNSISISLWVKKKKKKKDQHDYCIAMKTGMNMYLVFQYDYVVITKLFSFLVESKDGKRRHASDMSLSERVFFNCNMYCSYLSYDYTCS